MPRAGYKIERLNPAAPVLAAMSATVLARLAQNPVGNLISVRLQYNTSLDFGPEMGTQNVLNIQPVTPVPVNSNWNIITRTMLPGISMSVLERLWCSHDNELQCGLVPR